MLDRIDRRHAGRLGHAPPLPVGLLQSPLDESSASLAYRYGSGTSISRGAQTALWRVDVGTSESGFTSLVGHRDLTPGFILLALLLAMAWGALHALSPGHGKSIVAAYLIGSRGTARHAAFLGATVTVTHTAGVFALGLVTLFLSHYIVPETLYPWLGLISGLIVVAMGASILARRLVPRGRRDGGAHHHHHQDHDHDHSHHHDHDHDHGPAGHSHLPPGADGGRITTRSMLALGVSGGILPCPSALVVMLGAIALHRAAFGLALVVAFSLGLAADADVHRRAGRLRRPPHAAGCRPGATGRPLDPRVQRSGDYGARRRSDDQGTRHLPRRRRRAVAPGGRPAVVLLAVGLAAAAALALARVVSRSRAVTHTHSHTGGVGS